jgi:hypothetical protein
MIVVRKNRIWNLLSDNILITMAEINWIIHTSVQRCLLAPVQVTVLTDV